jgi:hypothetical protein
MSYLVKLLVKVNMAKVLMIMQHIALCTPCIALLLVSHAYTFCDRPRGARTRGTPGASRS